MLNTCAVSFVKLPFAEGPAHVYKAAHFMQRAYLHEMFLWVQPREDIIFVGRHDKVKTLFVLNNHWDLIHSVQEHLPVAYIKQPD